MSTPSPAALWLLAAVAIVAAASEDGMTHLHLYIHESFTGANATAITVAGSCPPLGGNDEAASSFGSVRAIDDELREGSDAASQLFGHAEGMLVQADLGSPAAWCTVLTLAFTEGDYSGSTLLVNGRADLGSMAVVERGIVGGTGRFRLARGYSLMTKYENNNPTQSTVVFEMDLYVKMGI